jgi:hypothetical protein
MKRLRIVAAIPTLVCTVCLSRAAEAAITQMNNVNDPVNHPYVESANNSSCTSNSICRINFPPTATKETLIQHVSCYYFLPTNAVTVYAYAFNTSTSLDYNFLPISNYGSLSNGAGRAINENTYLFLKTGEALEVVVEPSGGAVEAFQCTISGYHN